MSEPRPIDPFVFLRRMRNTFSGRTLRRGMRLGTPQPAKLYGERKETASARRKRKRVEQRHNAARLNYNAAKVRQDA